MGTPAITTEMMIEAVRREIGFRNHVYPRRIADGKMTKEKADHEIRCMIAVLSVLEAKLKIEGRQQASLLPEEPF